MFPPQFSRYCISSGTDSSELYFWAKSFTRRFAECLLKYIVHLSKRLIERFDNLLALISSGLNLMQFKEAEELIGDDLVVAE
jgi:hypothetical protein